MSANDRLQQVIKSAPIDETARRVTSKGIHYTPSVQATDRIFEGPPPMREVDRSHRRNAAFVDLTGMVAGRLTVLGLARDSQDARWVCRCACGNYVMRRARTLKDKEKASKEACGRCYLTNKVKRNYHHLKTGEWLPETMEG